MNKDELQWMDLLAKSCVGVRSELNDGVSPNENDLYRLINRAEALLFHLAKRVEIGEILPLESAETAKGVDA